MDVKYGWEQLVRATRFGWNRGWNHTRKRKQKLKTNTKLLAWSQNICRHIV
jgi:hypothetical protein